MSVFAREGDKVTCANGHPICTVAQDIHTGEILTGSQFKDWVIPVDPQPGTRVPSCPQCGAMFAGKPYPWEGNKLFVNGEWRP